MAAAVAAVDLLYASLGLTGLGRLLGSGTFRLVLGLISVVAARAVDDT